MHEDMDTKVDYFIGQTNDRLKSIETKIDELISFRLMLIGASVTISSIMSVSLTVLGIWLSHK